PTLLAESPCTGQRGDTEFFPTSPFILTPFVDARPLPRPRHPRAGPEAGDAPGLPRPSAPAGCQSSDGTCTHSLWPSDIKAADGKPLPEPVHYLVCLQNAMRQGTTCSA